MLRTHQLIGWIKQLVPGPYFANEFPPTSPELCVTVSLSPGIPPSQWSNVVQPSFQLIVRGPPSDDTAEERAFALQRALHNRTEFSISGQRVVHCAAEQPGPAYIGTDENGRVLYSLNFDLTMQT